MNINALKLKSIQFAAEEYLGTDRNGTSLLKEIIGAVKHFEGPKADFYETSRLIFEHIEMCYGERRQDAIRFSERGLTDDEIIFAVQLARMILKEQP